MSSVIRTTTTTRKTRLAALTLTALAAPALAIPLAGQASAATPTVKVFSASGADAAGIQKTVDAYRAALGSNNGSNAPAADGRREINWDGVPDNLSAPNNLPPDFFNTVVPRGAVFATDGKAVQVSADTDNPTNTAVRFGNLTPEGPDIFATFSPQRLFTAVGSRTVTVKFFVPGTKKKATVDGFGSVFTDVDLKDSSRIDYYDKYGKLLTRQYVKPGPVKNKSLSFLGVKFDKNVVAEVKIVSGNAKLRKNAKDGYKGTDLAVMDDFVYGEPVKY